LSGIGREHSDFQENEQSPCPKGDSTPSTTIDKPATPNDDFLVVLGPNSRIGSSQTPMPGDTITPTKQFPAEPSKNHSSLHPKKPTRNELLRRNCLKDNH
jgi:hypothetical protein